MDLPWNPAVLEQRIGRVHRLGQQQPVRVVNFISQGTIEEGMLSVLKFKKSLFAGVLDGGQSEVFLGGTRLNQFMKTVEEASESIPAPAADEPPAEAPGTEAATQTAESETGADSDMPASVPAPADPWSGLLENGLNLLQQLASASRSSEGAPASPSSSLVRRDQQTGQPYLHLPMPSPDTMNKILTALSKLLK